MKTLLAAISLTLALGTAASAEEAHKHDFAPDVASFHEILAPLWHAEAGPERNTDICSSLVTLQERADAIDSADASALVQSVSALGDACAGDDAAIEAAFSAAHDAFHALIGK